MQMQTVYSATFYSSGTITATGNTGVIAVPTFGMGSASIIPVYFHVIGASMTTDETNDVTIDWYADSGGLATLGTTTFNQLTASVLGDFEGWPGDVTAFNVARDFVPLPPYHKITHTLAGTTKSMSYIVYITYLSFA